MTGIWTIICITALSGITGTGFGGVIGAVLRRDSKRIVSLLLGLAAGVMLSVVCFDLIEDALGDTVDARQLFLSLAGISVGYMVIFLFNLAIDRHTNKQNPHTAGEHPKTADDLDELIHSEHLQYHKRQKNGLFIAGVIMACAIALHNLPEGIVIGASYAKDALANGGQSGLRMALVIGLHNIPEGMAVAVPLVSGGGKRTLAALTAAASGAPTVLGAVIGYYFGMLSPLALTLSLGFAGGAMLYVVLGELLPEAILMWRSKAPAAAAFVGVLAGLLLIYL